MQLGMIGLGRMGANMVRRLIAAATSASSSTSSPTRSQALVKESAIGAASLDDFVAKLHEAARDLADGAGGAWSTQTLADLRAAASSRATS